MMTSISNPPGVIAALPGLMTTGPFPGGRADGACTSKLLGRDTFTGSPPAHLLRYASSRRIRRPADRKLIGHIE